MRSSISIATSALSSAVLEFLQTVCPSFEVDPRLLLGLKAEQLDFIAPIAAAIFGNHLQRTSRIHAHNERTALR